ARRPRPVRHRPDAGGGDATTGGAGPRRGRRVMSAVETTGAALRPVAKSRWRRLILAQTAIDFWGRRKVWLGISAALIAISFLSFATRGLVLGIDFEGGVAWDVPAGKMTVN